jgi:hypothetical protein
MYIVLRRSYGFPVLANIFLPLTSHFPQINVTTVTHTPWRSKRTKSRRTYIIPHIIAKLGSSLPLFCSIQGSLYLSLKLEFVEVLCFLTETPWRLEFRLLQAHQRTVSNKKLTRFRHPFLSQSPTRKKYVEFLLPLGKSRPWEYAWSWRRKQRMLSKLTKKLNPLMV